MKKALVGIVLIIGLGLVATLMLDRLARVKNAAAMESAARAVQIQATAGAVTTVGLTLVIVLLVAMIVALIVLVVVMARRASTGKDPSRQEVNYPPTPSLKGRGAWTSGPNARWGKRLPVGGQDRITAEELARALMIARMLDGQGGPTALPSGEVEDTEAWEGLFGL